MRAVILLVLLLSSAFQASAKHGFSIGAGTNVGRGDHVPMDFYRVTYKRDWDKSWFNEGNWSLRAHTEFSVIRILSNVEVKRKFASSNLTGVAITPVFRYQRVPYGNGMSPYVEFGIGISYFSGNKIQSQPYWFRDYGSNFHFEDRLSFGLEFNEKYSFSVDYTHYSNFDFAPPNEGLDLLSASFSMDF